MADDTERRELLGLIAEYGLLCEEHERVRAVAMSEVIEAQIDALIAAVRAESAERITFWKDACDNAQENWAVAKAECAMLQNVIRELSPKR